jgi:hypothetical protein
MALMSVTKFPSVQRGFAEGDYSAEAWTNPSFMLAVSDSYGYVNAATFDSPDKSQVIVTGGHAFMSGANQDGIISLVPHRAVITGFQVNVVRYGTNGPVQDALVQLTKDGTTGIGSNMASSGTWGAKSTMGTYSYGGSRSLDVWGLSETSISIEEICGTGFGVRFAVQAAGTDSDAYVDAIWMQVHYETIPGEVYSLPPRRGRFLASRDGDVANITRDWITAAAGSGSMGTFGFSHTQSGTFGTTGAGTHSTGFTAGTFYFAGTVAMALGSAGTVTPDAGTYGTGREIYFCSTAGTSKAMPTGPVAFMHYFISTRGYSSTSFTFGTSPTGTAGTQINFTGTAGTHMMWVKWLP